MQRLTTAEPTYKFMNKLYMINIKLHFEII